MDRSNRFRLIAAAISLVVGVALMAAKFVAYRWTGSAVVLSDALESIVNVVAAAFALWVLGVAGRPADRSHPYGHGKLEYFSAVFEGGLISFAALLILYEAAIAFLRGPRLQRIDAGLAIVLGAGLANAALGAFLLWAGKRTRSITLTADGQHVLSDFWTSLGAILGLLLVRLTGKGWIDPLVAALVGLNLARTGARLVRRAGGGLLDEEDPDLIRHIVQTFDRTAHPGIIRLHHLRAMRAGRFAHVDAHLVVPEYWSVDQAHGVVERFECRMVEELHVEGEIVFHTDPCRRAYCPACDVDPCPVRRAPFRGRDPLTAEEATRPDPARTFLDPIEPVAPEGGGVRNVAP